MCEIWYMWPAGYLAVNVYWCSFSRWNSSLPHPPINETFLFWKQHWYIEITVYPRTWLRPCLSASDATVYAVSRPVWTHSLQTRCISCKHAAFQVCLAARLPAISWILILIIIFSYLYTVFWGAAEHICIWYTFKHIWNNLE